ncbi:MAG: glycosyltransferase [Bacteroidales bacterium]|nr:glycosyltransferase [Candidatus Colicola caccequi]
MTKLNVLYICNDYDMFFGASVSLMRMIHALRNDVHPIVLVYGGGDVQDYCIEHNIECIVHPFFYMWDKPRKLKTILHHPSKSTLYRYYKLNNDCANYVADQLQGRHIDIVHSNSSITTVGIDIAKRLGVRHIWHVREFLDLDFHLDIFMGIPRLRRLINHADARVCISPAVAKHWRFKEENTHVIFNAIQSESEISYIERKEPYFLFCAGNLGGTKHADDAIRAFAASNLSNQGYKLKLVGGGSEEELAMLHTLAQQLYVVDYVEFCGYQHDVKEYFLHATAFLMMSENEAMGRVTVEAMFYGCPVIARNTGGSTGFIRNKENGYLFNSLNDCVFYMQLCAQGNQESVIMSAQNTARELFTEEEYRNHIMRVYHHMLAK